jgi:hypothetical protein
LLKLPQPKVGGSSPLGTTLSSLNCRSRSEADSSSIGRLSAVEGGGCGPCRSLNSHGVFFGRQSLAFKPFPAVVPSLLHSNRCCQQIAIDLASDLAKKKP